VEIRLLGPVEVHAAGRRVPVRPPQRLVVLAALAVDADRVVPVDTLIRRVWEKPPKQDRRTLHAHISHVRTVLREASAATTVEVRLAHRAAGYLLQIDRDRIDLHRFHTLVAKARAACDDHAAEALFAEAVALWRGEAFAGLGNTWLDSVRASAEQERWAAELDRTEVRLRLGQHGELVGGLATAVAAHPTDERLAGQYMLALHRCGRQADALAHYERMRKRLENRVGALGPALRQLRQKILTGTPDLQLPGSASPPSALGAPASVPLAPHKANRTLPADVAGFVGRDRELRRLLEAADAAAAAAAQTVTIHAVDGMAGVGKTAFAVHAAHRLAPRFPDGQRFVELRAHAPAHNPVDPAAALEVLLQADGIAAQQIPTGLEARAGLWRERMVGKRMLLVLDDAADTAHVAPLLPAAPGCLVLITSRRKLATLPGAMLLTLDTLPPADAAELFAHRAGPNAHDDPVAARRIVRLCGYLPLAITLTAARLHTHPAWTVTDLADDLDQTRDRLAELASGDLAVAAAFDLSYRDLPTDRQRLFRRLALHPGEDFDVCAAAALDGTSVPEARRALEGLLEHNLLTEPHRGRYRFHDLISAHARAYAAGDPAPDRDAAIERLLDYYLHLATVVAHRDLGYTPVATLAVTTAAPAGGPTAASPPPDVDWFTVEQSNLAAATIHAADRAHPAAIGIPAAMNEHLRSHGPFDLGVQLHQTALAAARRIGDQPSEARALINLAHLLRVTGDRQAAASAAEQAEMLCQRIGDTAGQASALNTLALVRALTKGYLAGAAAAERAIVLYQQIGDRHGQATALTTLGRVQQVIGDFSAAAATAEQARSLFSQLGDWRGQAIALDIVARVRSLIGDYPSGVAAAGQAQALHRRAGNHHGLANALNTLAHLQHATGDLPAALASAETALTLHEQLGNQHGRATALHILAAVQHATGANMAAATTADQARAIYDQLDDRLGLANAVLTRALIHQASGDRAAALDGLHDALTLFRQVGDPDGEAETLNHIGQFHLDANTPVATQRFATALDIARRIGTPTHEARALEGMGRCFLQQGNHEDGLHHLRQALTIYERIHSPRSRTVQATIDTTAARQTPR
jgi:DNA-binding SARP family transcriptional activator/tetratricopeptide (TPR) repeat protein